MITISIRPLVVASLALAGCGTQFIGDVEGEELMGSEGGSSSSSGDPGQSATSAPASESSEGDTGAAPLCEEDPNAVCGPAPLELAVFGVPANPVGGPNVPARYDYDCTLTELEWIGADNTTVMADCGNENPTYLGTGMPEETFAKLSVGQSVHATFTESWDGNGHAMALFDDADALILLVYYGTDLEPMPGETPFAPFSVTAQEDLCLAPCLTDDRCYSWDRQRLDFVAEGVTAEIWQSAEATMTANGLDYLVTVTHAQGVEEVAPESTWCEIPAYAGYSFRIADVSP
jgi:hypothetical protein